MQNKTDRILGVLEFFYFVKFDRFQSRKFQLQKRVKLNFTAQKAFVKRD